MRLLIAGGGTGGHLLPALAVAQAFRGEVAGAEILVLGRSGGPEESLVPAAGLALRTVYVRGWDRDAPWKNLLLPLSLPQAVAAGVRLVGDFRPDVVLGVGGYVMTPGVAGAIFHRVPFVLQVSEAGGLANRIARPWARAACVTFPFDVDRFRTPRTVLTGYPLRAGFVPRVPEVPPRRLLVMGGSQGARRLNEAVWRALDHLLARFQEVVHLTGEQGEEEARRLLRPGYTPLAFTSEVPALMGRCDLVVARSGVGTVSELTAVGLPSILVPGAFGGGHQVRNAEHLVRHRAAVAVPDAEFDGPRLVAEIDGLTAPRLRAMALAARSLGRPEAARAVAGVLMEVARG